MEIRVQEQTEKSTKKSDVPLTEEPEVKFYWWFLATNYLHLVVYAIAVRHGDDFFYMEDHCMIRKCVKSDQSEP